MPASAQAHARSHALLLLQKLLNLRDGASPLTLVLDSLEQSSGPAAKSKVVFVSFATLKRARDVDVFVRARGKSLAALQAEITSHYPRGGSQTHKPYPFPPIQKSSS
ncbi:hypothetical protein DL771_006174 [Monosporascus sp. 5C6A]|nr:hypothetical protein DL771_006174 [Monosporascus sp. 5C6A]